MKKLFFKDVLWPDFKSNWHKYLAVCLGTLIGIFLFTDLCSATTYRAALVHNKEELWQVFSKSMTMEVTDSEITLYYSHLEDPICLTSNDQEVEVKVSVDCLSDHMNVYFKDTRPEDVLGTVYVLIEGEP